jgi:hypothetical protein
MSKLPSLRRRGGDTGILDLAAGDDRQQQARALAAVDDAGRQIVAQVFDGLVVSVETIRTVVDARTRIHDQWGKAQTAALLIGRTLLGLSRSLSDAEYLAVRRGSERLFPFSDSVATKLRRAAEIAEALSIPLERSPSYTLLYEISTMPHEGQDLVKSRGLIRADVTRAEILAIKAELKKHKIPKIILEHASEPSATVNLASVEARRNNLIAEREATLARLSEIDKEIAVLGEQIRILKPAGRRRAEK